MVNRVKHFTKVKEHSACKKAIVCIIQDYFQLDEQEPP